MDLIEFMNFPDVFDELINQRLDPISCYRLSYTSRQIQRVRSKFAKRKPVLWYRKPCKPCGSIDLFHSHHTLGLPYDQVCFPDRVVIDCSRWECLASVCEKFVQGQ